MSTDVIVVGGGIVGSALALRAAQLGASCLVIDAPWPGRATDAGAGIVSPATNTRDPDAWQVLATAAAAAYPSLAATLVERGVTDPGYGLVGELVVALNDVEAAELAAAHAVMTRRASPVETISPSEARALVPHLAEPVGALFCPTAARVDGRSFAAGLRQAASTHGVIFEAAEVGSLLLGPGAEPSVVGVETTLGRRSAGAVALVGGAWSAQLVGPLGLDVAVQPQRGQIVHLQTAHPAPASWPIVAAVTDHYQVAWPDGRVAVGATRETGSGYATEPTAGGIGEVLAEALRVSPGLSTAALAEIRVGLRPITADLLPILGTVSGIGGLYVATGHGPTGLTLGPFTAGLVAEMMAGITPGYDLSAFAYERPGLRPDTGAPPPLASPS